MRREGVQTQLGRLAERWSTDDQEGVLLAVPGGTGRQGVGAEQFWFYPQH